MSSSPHGATDTRARDRLKSVRGNPLAILSIAVLLLVVSAAVAAPLITLHHPNDIHLDHILHTPNAVYWFGTDELGRDLFSRVVYGARPSLIAAFAIVAVGAGFGLLLGCLTGYLGGLFDLLFMRLVEVMMALPGLVVALALTAALGPSLKNAVIAIGIMSIPAYIRLARGQTLSIKEKEYVLSAKVAGAKTWYVMRQHLIPNVLPPVLVFMTFHLGSAILASSALSFIGLGAQPPDPEWGSLIGTGKSYLNVHWWYCLFPGLAIVLTAAALNILGDTIRDMLDTR